MSVQIFLLFPTVWSLFYAALITGINHRSFCIAVTGWRVVPTQNETSWDQSVYNSVSSAMVDSFPRNEFAQLRSSNNHYAIDLRCFLRFVIDHIHSDRSYFSSDDDSSWFQRMLHDTGDTVSKSGANKVDNSIHRTKNQRRYKIFYTVNLKILSLNNYPFGLN